MSDDNLYLTETLARVRQRLLDQSLRNRLLNYRESARDVAVIDELPDEVYARLIAGRSFYFDAWAPPPPEEAPAFDDEATLARSSDARTGGVSEETQGFGGPLAAAPERPERAAAQLPSVVEPGVEVDGGETPARTLPCPSGPEAPVAPEHRDGRLQTPFIEKALEARLAKLYQQHRLEIGETGANPLHLAVGFLRWKDERDTSVGRIAPLILLPVSLERERARGGGKHLYRLAFEDSDLEPNYSLTEKLRADFGIDLPPLDDEFSPEAYLGAVADCVAFKQKDGWALVREMALGLFRFRKQIMWHDLDPERWPESSPLLSNALVRRTLLGASSEDEPPGIVGAEYDQDDPDAPDAAPHLPLVLDADNTQYAALVDALGADSGGLVIEGPPGTGKSQTIANLIGAALAAGKRVLFIAEKMAALGVVHRRLESLGLAPFCLALHGLKANKRELLDDLQARIDLRAQVEGPSGRAARNEARDELLAMSRALREPVGPEQVPLHEAVWRVESMLGELPADFEPVTLEAPHELTAQLFDDARLLLDDYQREWAGVPRDAHLAWTGFDASGHSDGTAEQLLEALGQFESGAAAAREWMDRSGVSAAAPSHDSPVLWLKLARLSDAEFPAFPLDGDAALAYAAIHGDAIESLGQQVERLHRYLDTVAAASRVFDCAAPEAAARARTLYQHCDALVRECCGKSVRLADLEREHADLAKLVQQVERTPKLVEDFARLVGEHPRTLDGLDALSETMRTLVDAPPEVSLHYEDCHLRPGARDSLEHARAQAQAIETFERDKLDGFEPRRVTDVDALGRAVDAVRLREDSWFPLLSGEYRAARALIKATMRAPKQFSRTAQFTARLDQLVSYCRQRDAFAAHKDHAAALGRLFAGCGTRWDALESIVATAGHLRERVGMRKAGEMLASWDTHVAQTQETRRELTATIEAARTYLSSHPVPEILPHRPVTEIVRHLRAAERKLSEALGAVDLSVYESTATLEQAIAAARAFDRSRQLEAEITSRPGFEALLGPRWQGASTAAAPITQTFEWIRSALVTPCMNKTLLRWLFPDASGPRAGGWNMLLHTARTFHGSFRLGYQTLMPIGKLNPYGWVGGDDASFGSFTEKLAGCRENVASLPLLRRIHERAQQLRDAGCGGVIDALSKGCIEPGQCKAAFTFSVYRSAIATHAASVPRLRNFSRTSFESLRERFVEADRDDRGANASELVRTLLARAVPEGQHHGKVADYTDQHLIVHEARKKQRHVPVRQLMQRAGAAVQALKPCFFMSPMSVAQYLPPGALEFDLVVMDEASQVRPEDALGALARAARAIVVGDPKQLPPTAFFQGLSAEDEDQEETVMDDVESILDVCIRQYPYRRLRWHYRSQHERLIQFSNERFYDGDLLVFPSPKQGLKEFGVHGHHVSPSSYVRGRNRAEAELVVANAVRHFQRHPRLSLGIATFGRKQQEEIQLRLDKARLDDSALDLILSEHEQGDEPLFVKNLENVQGDERDVIFISATYGPERDSGVVMQRFGPINTDQGWRRLNVIATRARQRVEVFSSMRHTDIQIDNAARGRLELRNYLEYAMTGRMSETGELTGRAPDSTFEVAVARVINQLGYETVPQVGVAGFFIDLGVRHPYRPGEFLAGIECDGAGYHSSKSVRDRDRLRQEVLEAKGWRIHRIWSASWFHERAAEVERLKLSLDSLAVADRAQDRLRTTLEPPHALDETVLDHFDEEVIVDADTVNGDELAEGFADGEPLVAALERFRERSLGSQTPIDASCILNDAIIERLVAHRPESRRAFHEIVPDAEFDLFAPDQQGLVDDVLDIVAEYG